ncbi:MAG: hypothetical protein U1F68_03035 [Gammaproteobacteria bacterium]
MSSHDFSEDSVEDDIMLGAEHSPTRRAPLQQLRSPNKSASVHSRPRARLASTPPAFFEHGDHHGMPNTIGTFCSTMT